MHLRTSLVFLAVLSSCVAAPITGALATGERLGIERTEETKREIHQVKVGEVRTSDRTRYPSGKKDVRELQSMNVTTYDWFHTQGAARVDESDFYRIGGDLERSAQVDEQRREAVTMQTIGALAIPVGLAIAATGAVLTFVPLQSVTNPDTGATTMQPILSLQVGVIIMGLGAALGGATSTAFIKAGNAVLAPGVKLLPESDAQQVMEKYNATLKQ